MVESAAGGVTIAFLHRPACKLHYIDEGSGQRALVFLHGWCDDSTVWRPTIDALRDSFRCLALDMRGHGRSERPRDHAYFIQALELDVRAVCSEADVTRPILIGHSYGAGLAIKVAERFPDFAAACVMVDQPLEDDRGLERLRKFEKAARTPGRHAAVRQHMKDQGLPDGTPQRVVRQVMDFADRIPEEVSAALWASQFERTDEEIIADTNRLLRAFALQPTLVVDAEERPEYRDRVLAVAPDTRFEVIPGSHWIHLEHPEQFSTMLAGFLAQLE